MSSATQDPPKVTPEDRAAELADAVPSADLTPSPLPSLQVDEPPAPGLSARPSVDLARTREDMRGRIARWLVLILAFVVVASWLLVGVRGAVTPEEIESITDLLQNTLTPLVGLVGAATGFYFGRDH